MSEGGDALVPSRSDSPELLLASVLATLTSEKTKQAYATALTDFFAWTAARWRSKRPGGSGRFPTSSRAGSASGNG